MCRFDRESYGSVLGVLALRVEDARATGREYSTVITVPLTVCDTLPRSLRLTCAVDGSGSRHVMTSNAAVRASHGVIVGPNAGGVRGSAELRVHGGPDLVQRAAATVQPVRQSRLALADLAVLSHSVPLEAGQQRIVIRNVGAAAGTADAIHDVRNLADKVEDARGRGIESLGGCHTSRGDARPWVGMVQAACAEAKPRRARSEQYEWQHRKKATP